MLHFHINWLDFEIVMTFFGTAKTLCSNTFDQYCICAGGMQRYYTVYAYFFVRANCDCKLKIGTRCEDVCRA